MWILNASEDGHPGRLALLIGCDGVWTEYFLADGRRHQIGRRGVRMPGCSAACSADTSNLSPGVHESNERMT